MNDNHELAAALCKAIGLDAGDVTGLTVRFDVGGVIRVSADVRVIDGKRIGQAFEEFELTANSLSDRHYPPMPKAPPPPPATTVRKRPPKPPSPRYVCSNPACGHLTPGQPHKSWMCRLMNGGAIVGAEDEYVFDEDQRRWRWRRVGEISK